ncbi:hypothetical protein [Coleofasciculus chthonoplastes]|jgi:hypothetical protein|uniref:Uncharacterized protein n=1 Tax=Coleofasciculus chthonoplastes PCC 7420 TaxID=118168 RepID=B4VHJ7_9CYAN|nr:hypothetical protein [Coleofasciculus chthonoplastes]EDX78769.1 hypothetical protein MC7420_7422 [Coleofasciculus chthonoplastes PCC 7420]
MVYKQHELVQITKGSLKGHTGKIAASSHDGIYFIQGNWNSHETGASNLYGPLLGDEITPVANY